ncbi:hypothetical protein KUTeg_004145 [Tegillarca granosa]|uniref:Uncharacterized protein n=1 Tax=Tegillarca granosa TaxID=220873 RepID=A0ABQ9FP32_TEGGR|nr:hypothetical protein KUTeg_004145 [Tegillarca granosa]
MIAFLPPPTSLQLRLKMRKRETNQKQLTPSTSRFKKCPPEDDTYCLNNGECRIIVLLDYRMCNSGHDSQVWLK